ncbi:MAG: MG2 domain-containing protein [Vicinamibacteria bacterium]
MSSRGRFVGAALGLLIPTGVAAADLRVRSAGPTGEIAQLAQANEIRVVFAEPMVALGKIPEPVTAPFFRMAPARKGAFRWAGTDTLIFTPEGPLPFATRFAVTIDPTATSVAGNRLPAPYEFSFTTPTVKLLRTSWYRKTRRFDAPVVIALRFNQPVEPYEVAKHLSLRYEPHPWTEPALPEAAKARLATLDPASAADFEAKVAAVRAATQSRAIVPYLNAVDWDKKAFPPAADLVVLETKEVPPTDAWLLVSLDGKVPAAKGDASSQEAQKYTVKLEPTLFVEGPSCSAQCDPESYNPLRLRASVKPAQLRSRLRVWDVTDAAAERLLKPRKMQQAEEGEEEEEAPSSYDDEYDYDHSSAVDLEHVGYPLKAARTYAIAVGRDLKSHDGQTLGYTWVGSLENWHQNAFSSFGSGHGVWESGGGSQLPFSSRNLRTVTQWAQAITPDELMPTVRRLEPEGSRSFDEAPPVPGTPRTLRPKADVLQAYGLDLAPVLASGKGLVWTALEDGQPIARTRLADTERRHATIVQVTNLGISVKDSPANTLVLVTRLDDGQPVAGATVTIRDLENRKVWTGTTDANGLALAPDTDLRDHDNWWKFRFIVTAEKDGDVAYVGSDWNEGIEPWAWGGSFDLDEASPLLRGSVFADRGVYKLGEEVHFKAVLRSDTAKGIVLLPAGAAVKVVLKNGEGDEVDSRSVALSQWSSAEWTLTLPADGRLGNYEVTATVDGQQRAVSGRFLVAAYRRPEFRVDANLAGETSVAGVALKGVVNGRYLFGAPMAGRDVKWTFSRAPLGTVPAKVGERFPADAWAFLVEDAGEEREYRPTETLKTEEVQLDAEGLLTLDLATPADAGRPWAYTLEGEVTDVTRQTIAGRASFRVDPAPWYLAVKRPPYFGDADKGVSTEIAAVGLDGAAAAGVEVKAALTQIQWNSVRRAEGNGFYTWDVERKEVPAGEWTVVTEDKPVPLQVPLPSGGYFVLKVTATDAEGHSTTTSTGFYVLGGGYTAWARYDHNRIDLLPEKKTYRPGETARLMIKSPWEQATALLTTEREGVRTYEKFELTSTQQTVTVKVREEDIPNVFVSVLLVKGRSGAFTTEDASDPGKPAFRLGYAELKVEDGTRRLKVALATDREEYRPAAKAKVDVAVTDAAGKPAASEVTLWAVDYGVLSLTGYDTPDLLGSVYLEKALQVMNQDSRQRIISRRVLTPKGADEGGGGGADDGPGNAVRKDFRVLAFWLGSVPTDANGRATATVTLPESLTTYRVMAVAGDRQSRFGRGDREIRISKPVLLRAAFPRFLTKGDRALFGAAVTSQLKEGGTAIVTMRSLDPSVLAIDGDAKQTVKVAAKGTQEVRFSLRAVSSGRARIQMSVKLQNETDAFEESLPVTVVVSPEVVAAYGSTDGKAVEALDLPAGIDPARGGLRLELASTALVGLGEGARYLVTYPYGCAEQRASSAMALMLAADLGEAFRLPDIEPAKLKEVTTATLKELEAFQCEGGGFAYWKGSCTSQSPYLTSYVMHVLARGRKLGYPVPAKVTDGGYDYLQKSLATDRPTNEGWWPAFTAWQAFAAKVLSEGGRNADSHVTRLYGHRERMPVFGLAYLRDAMTARGEKGERPADLDRRLGNAMLPEGGTAHVEELSDPYLLWYWNSNVRSTAIALGALVRGNADPALEPRVVRWLMKVREKGRWGNTQENAWAMESLVDYYRARESDVPDFTAVVALGLDTLSRTPFQGRSSVAQIQEIPQADLAKKARPGERTELSFTREGAAGTLHYGARYTYVPTGPVPSALDQGFGVERTYAPAKNAQAPGTRFQAGELVKVTLRFRLPKERRYVAIEDPLPAGFEPVESGFATTAQADAEATDEQGSTDWNDWWERGGFDHVERHDDKVRLFATRLSEGEHEYSYLARATTAGTFQAGPTRAEEMYEPEVFGRTAGTVVEVRP